MNLKSTRTLVLSLLLVVFGASPALSQVVYDSTVTPLPGNLPSVGAQAYAFEELGDNITLAGTARSPKSVIVTMSSWGCQNGAWFSSDCVSTPGATFSIPITLNLYNAGSPTPGSLIATTTQSFNIPYRPSSDNTNCTGGRWYQASSNTCFNGLANNITFDLSSLNIVLPDSLVFGISYDTTSYGPNPIGTSAACFSTSAGCPYDSLNIALSADVVVGSKPFTNTLYWNNAFASNYCDGGLEGTGEFRLDSSTNACWYFPTPADHQIPAVQFISYTIATTPGSCKNNGWQSLARTGGSSFKNQGDCIQYLNTGK